MSSRWSCHAPEWTRPLPRMLSSRHSDCTLQFPVSEPLYILRPLPGISFPCCQHTNASSLKLSCFAQLSNLICTTTLWWVLLVSFSRTHVELLKNLCSQPPAILPFRMSLKTLIRATVTTPCRSKSDFKVSSTEDWVPVSGSAQSRPSLGTHCMNERARWIRRGEEGGSRGAIKHSVFH